MNLLRELTTDITDHVPIMEAIAALSVLDENTQGGRVNLKGASKTAKDFMKGNPALVIGAAALAIGAYSSYKKNKRNTITLHAKDAYERRMMTSIVDALITGNKFRIVRTKFQNSGKTWVLKRVGTQL